MSREQTDVGATVEANRPNREKSPENTSDVEMEIQRQATDFQDAPQPDDTRDQDRRLRESAKEQKNEQRAGGPNVGPVERDLSVAAGVGLAILGLRHPTKLSNMAMMTLGAMLIHRGWTGTCGIYKALGIDHSRSSHGAGSAKPEEYMDKSVHVEHSISINKPAEELYRFWHNFENLPTFMDHLREVKQLESRRSHWVANGPLGSSIQWEAEIINEEENKLIAWRSIGNPDVHNSGSVRFEPSVDQSQTVVKVVIDWIPPGGTGKVGSWIASLLGEDPEQKIKSDLRRFKQLMETGELTSNAGGEPRGMC